jgi:hypothetical protein
MLKSAGRQICGVPSAYVTIITTLEVQPQPPHLINVITNLAVQAAYPLPSHYGNDYKPEVMPTERVPSPRIVFACC